MKIARLIGGAGTGKTTELLRIMEEALKTIKDPTMLGFASFTRAARAEAVNRASAAWNIEPDVLQKAGWFRTVHSTVLRCLEDAADEIISDKKSDTEWLANVLGVKLHTEIDESYGTTRYIGDEAATAALKCWSIARVTLTPLETTTKRLATLDDNVGNFDSVLRYVERYEAGKRIDSKMDFNDALLRFAGISIDPRHGISMTEPRGYLPGVKAWLFDEQQDASPLLDAVCKRLISAPSVQWCYVVGDPFQSIYGFAGSSAACFMSWNADKQRIMPKSYRCPRPVLELGERCLRLMSESAGYFDRMIEPADHEGSVRDAALDEVIPSVRPDQDWLFIARTNFQAERMAKALYSRAIPSRWTNANDDGVSARGIGLAAIHDLCAGKMVRGAHWAEAIALLPQKVAGGGDLTVRGMKAKWKRERDGLLELWDWVVLDDVTKIGGTDLLVKMISDGSVFSLIDRGTGWKRCADKWGVESANNPKIRVGTIHSVKGSEADNVVLMTATSRTVSRAYDDDATRDEEHRIAYVGVTRARRNLFVVDESRDINKKMEVIV